MGKNLNKPYNNNNNKLIPLSKIDEDVDIPNTEDYKFKKRKCFYMTENYEISSEEQKRLNSIIKKKINLLLSFHINIII